MRDVTSLRRKEPAAQPKAEPEAPPARYDVEWAPTPGSAPANDRRRNGDPGRRGMDKLRADALKAVIAQVEDRNFNGLRERANVQWSRVLPPSRIALIVVALMAAGGAAYLATQHEEPAAVTTPIQPVKAPTTQVLGAKQAIAPGDRLAPATLEWQEWPDTSLHDDFITATKRPDALKEMSGILARTDIAAGAPILDQELVPASGGYLAAILEKGMRGVSVSITAEGASGGFVVPNDRVDVVLTRQSTDGRQESQTILHDVRVLAINTRASPTTAAPADTASSDPSGSNAASEAFVDHALATLELNPQQAEIVINATTLGRLSLMLRPATEAGGAASSEEQRAAANAAIRLTSPFWTK